MFFSNHHILLNSQNTVQKHLNNSQKSTLRARGKILPKIPYIRSLEFGVSLITGVIYVVKFLFPEKNPLYPAFPYIVVSLYFI